MKNTWLTRPQTNQNQASKSRQFAATAPSRRNQQLVPPFSTLRNSPHRVVPDPHPAHPVALDCDPEDCGAGKRCAANPSIRILASSCRTSTNLVSLVLVIKRTAVQLFRRVALLRIIRRSEPIVTPWGIIVWWETRRILYNLVVGIMGLVVSGLLLICGLVCERLIGEPIGIPDPPIVALIGVVLYGVLANICYTGGWIAELLVQAVWGEKAGRFGEISFTLGFLFSIFLTCVPAIFVLPAAAIQLVLHYRHGM